MKFEVKWTADNQVIETDYVDSLNNSGAESQVRSMRGNMPGFRIIGVYGVREQSNNYSHTSSYTNVDRGDSPYEVSATVATIGILSGGLLVVVGLFMLPVGIIVGIIGGAVGWLSWKLGTWLSDKGW